MKDLLEYIVKNLVNNPDSVSITEEQEDSILRLNLTVNSEDMGIIIGRGGQTIKSIRKVIGVRAMMENLRVYVNIIEPEGGSKNTENNSEILDEAEANEQSPEPSEPESGTENTDNSFDLPQESDEGQESRDKNQEDK